MYSRRGGGGGSKAEMIKDDRNKQINDALDKHLERSSPSSSRNGGAAGGLAFKDKDRFLVLSGNGKASLQQKLVGNLCSTTNYFSLLTFSKVNVLFI